jgi:hypothetical protein
MPRLVVAHRLEELQIGEAAASGAGPFSLSILRMVSFAHRATLLHWCPDNVARHDRGRRLAQCTGFDLVREIAHPIAIHLQPDLDLGSAQFRMRRCLRVGVFQHACARYVAGEIKNPGIVHIIDHHERPFNLSRCDNC